MPETQASHKYFAFISYSRKDRKAAAWLQKRLEWFRFPIKQVPEDRRPPHPKCIQPIYRDTTNLPVTADHYWKNIRLGLETSRFLIVLCSPNSAHPRPGASEHPVNMEVEHFLQTHGDDSALVVPVILSGNVTSDGEDAALCPALRALGDKLINRNLPSMVPDVKSAEKDGWEKGFADTVSYLLGLESSAIGDHIQRETRRQARTLRRWLVAVGAMTVCAILGAAIAISQKQRAENLLWTESYADCESAARSFAIQHHNEGTALLQRALSRRPMNRSAVAASGLNAFGLSAQPWRLRSVAMMEGPVTHISVSNKSGLIAAVSEKGDIDLIDSVSGRLVARSRSEASQAREVAFNDQGTELTVIGWNEGERVLNDETVKLIDEGKLGVHVRARSYPEPGKTEIEGTWDKAAWVVDTSSGGIIKRIDLNPKANSIHLSRNGHYIAAPSADQTLRIYDVASGAQVQKVTGVSGVLSISFSPDGLLIWVGGETPMLIDTQTGQPLWAAKAAKATEVEEQAHFSFDGHRVSRCYFKLSTLQSVFEVVDSRTGKNVLGPVVLQGSGPSSLSLDGDFLAMASGEIGTASHTLGLRTSNRNFELNLDAGSPVRSMSVSPDGQLLALGMADGNLEIHEISNQKKIARFQQVSAVTHLQFTQNGSFLISGGQDGAVRVYEGFAAGEVLRMDFPSQVNVVAFGGRAIFAVGSGDYEGEDEGQLRVADVETLKFLNRTAFDRSVESLSISENAARVAAGSFDMTARIVDLHSNNVLTHKFDQLVYDVSLSPDGRKLAVASGLMPTMTPGPDGKVYGVHYSSGSVSLLDSISGQEERAIAFKGEMKRVNFSPGGTYVAMVTPDSEIQLLDVVAKTTRMLAKLETAVHDWRFSPSGDRLALVTEAIKGDEASSSRVLIYEVKTGKLVMSSHSPGGVVSVMFSDDGKRLLCGLPGGRTIWLDALNGNILLECSTAGMAMPRAIHPQFECFASSDGSIIHLMSSESGKVLGSLSCSGNVNSLCFSKDGNYIGIGSSDHTARVYDVRWMHPSSPASDAWIAALQFNAGIRLKKDGTQAPMTAQELVSAQQLIETSLSHSVSDSMELDLAWLMNALGLGSNGPDAWERDILEWNRAEPTRRTVSPWSKVLLAKVAGAALQQAIFGSPTMRDCIKMAPWHPLQPLAVAWAENWAAPSPESPNPQDKADALNRSVRYGYLCRMTLKRLSEADEQIYGRDTLAEYAAWSAKILHEELHFDSEAMEAITFALERTPPEKQKALLDLKTKLETK